MKSAWTGFTGLEQEDAVISLSMGAISDRSREHLVAADRAVSSLRRMLLQAADRLEKGDGVKLPADLTDVIAPDVFVLKEDRAQWYKLTPNHWRSSPGIRDALMLTES